MFRGSLIVAKRDLAANTKSVRVVVISILTLLILVGAAFGISGLSPLGPGTQNEFVMWAYAVYPNRTAGLADAVIWVSDAFGSPRAGTAVYLGEPYIEGTFVFRVKKTNLTDADGWVRFFDLPTGAYPLEILEGGFTYTASVFVAAPPSQNFTATVQTFDLIGDLSFRDLAVHALRADGRPSVGAEVLLDEIPAGRTNGYGFYTQRLSPGTYNVTVVYEGETTPTQRVFVREPQTVLPFQRGPDGVLYFLALLMGFFGPILAIAVSYDALAKERMQGSLELLLVRPASRTGLALGKFLGSFLSIALPMLAVILGAVAGIVGLTGKWPTPGFLGAFALATLALVATYALIMQIFSTVVKSPGTAILSAVMVWLVFNVIWNVVFVVVSAALNVQGGTQAAFLLSAITSLFNPTGVYQITILAAAPTALFGGSGAGLPDWSGPVAFVLWIVVLLVLAVVLFQKKVV